MPKQLAIVSFYLYSWCQDCRPTEKVRRQLGAIAEKVRKVLVKGWQTTDCTLNALCWSSMFNKAARALAKRVQRLPDPKVKSLNP